MKFLMDIKQGFLTAVFILAAVFLTPVVQCYADIPPNAKLQGVNVMTSETSKPDMNDDPLGDFQSLTIPLKRAGHLFLIEVKIDGQVGNLIFDTGASGLVLNKTYFRKYVSEEKPAGGGVTGSFDKISRTMIGRIDIYGLYYEKIGADLTDLGHIENRRGVKILGLFGLNMINDFEVIFDANRSELQLNRIDKQGNRIDATIPGTKYDFTQKIETNHNIMLVKGKIGDKMMNFCLDTGAESNVISSDVPKKVMSTITISRRSRMGGAGAASVEALYGTMKEFEFGNRQFGNMETVVTSLDAMSEAYGCKIDGMLGYDFWQKGIFCFNFSKNEISFSFAKGDTK
jgi:predicted aspartyl protease